MEQIQPQVGTKYADDIAFGSQKGFASYGELASEPQPRIVELDSEGERFESASDTFATKNRVSAENMHTVHTESKCKTQFFPKTQIRQNSVQNNMTAGPSPNFAAALFPNANLSFPNVSKVPHSCTNFQMSSS